MKLPFPRRFKAWLVALVSLTAVAVVSIAPMMRPRAQSPPPTYTFTDLGTLGGTYSRATGINNCGMIVGEFAPSGTTPTHPFLWRDSNGNLLSDAGEMKDLGTLGGVRGVAADINASGLVVGTSTIANGEEHAFRWFDLDGDGTPDPGEMNDLGVLPNYSTHGAYGVNDNGQIVGSAESSAGPASGFIWNANTGLQLLATLNGIEPSHAYAINNSSHIAGYASSLNKAFVFNGTTNVNLGTFGGPRSIAYDINAAGHAVGFSDVDNSSASPPSHAFKWNGIALQDLGVLTGGVRSQANSLNSSGIVVGYSEVDANSPPTRRAFVHDGTQMYDLNALATNLPAGWVLRQANAINDGGQIVGEACTTNDCSSPTPSGQIRAFLLTPTAFTPSCSPTVTVTVSAAVAEDGATNLTYTFTRAPVTNTPVTVNFSTSGTATPAVDYAVSGTGITYDPNTGSGTVAFAAGEITKSVTVDPAADSDVEPNETVVLTTTAGPGYNVGAPAAATGTINNDDSIPIVSVAVSPLTTAEDGGADLVYTFTRSSTGGSLTVNFTVGGDAQAGTDYSQTGAASFTPTTGTVTFGPGSATATVTVDPTTDFDVEQNETVILTTTAGTGYTIAAAPLQAATGTINNDDSIPSVSVSVAPPSADEDGAPNLVYTFNRTGSMANALTANFAVGGTAGFSSDYGQTGAATFTASTGTVIIPAGMASATVTIDPSVDTTDEPNETVILTVTPNAAYTIGGTPAEGTITDDDGLPTIQITNVTGPEPPSGSTTFVFTVSLSHPSSGQITVNYATDTTGATATGGANCGGGVDFFNVSSTGLTFAAGETSKPVFVTVCTDANLEPDETFFVNLSGNSANSNLPTGTRGTGTITPQAPVLYVEAGTESNPIPNALAVDSVTFVRGPFRLVNDYNFSADKLTRVILVTSPLGMTNADLATGILSIHIAGYGQIPLANIEHVGSITGVSGLNASYIIVKLPAELSTLNPPPGPNNLTLTVKMGSAESNATTLSIIP